MTREEKEDTIAQVRMAFAVWEDEFDVGDDWSEQHKARDRAIEALKQESCEDAVSRKEIQQKINRLWNSNGDKDYCMETLRDFVTELSPVTPTRNKGKWIEVDTNMYTCSNCSYCFEIVPEVNSIQQFKCCPNCKTEMENK